VIEVDDQPTRVLVEQIRALDVSRLGEQVRILGLDELRRIDDALELVLDL